MIIGSGSGGLPVASMVAKNGRDNFDITVITKDLDIAYSPCGIPFVMKGDIPSYKSLIMRKTDHYRELGIDILTGTTVDEIDTGQQRVRAGSKWIDYDYLVIATGTAQKDPGIKGSDLEGVFSAHIKTLRDAERFDNYITATKRSEIVITGSGSIDLEFAAALKERGHNVTVIEKESYLMPERLDKDMAGYVEKYLREKGIRPVTGQAIQEIKGRDRVEKVVFDDLILPADIVLSGTDFIPEVSLARKAGLDTNRYGIKVDERSNVLKDGKPLKTVFSSGACANSINKVTGKPDFFYFGSTSVQRSAVVAETLLGKDVMVKGSTNPRITVLWDLHIGAVGMTSMHAKEHNVKVISCLTEGKNTARYYPGGNPVYFKLLFEERTAKLIGGQVISTSNGVKERIDALSIAISCGLTATELAHVETSYSPPASSLVDVMTETARKALD